MCGGFIRSRLEAKADLKRKFGLAPDRVTLLFPVDLARPARDCRLLLAALDRFAGRPLRNWPWPGPIRERSPARGHTQLKFLGFVGKPRRRPIRAVDFHGVAVALRAVRPGDQRIDRLRHAGGHASPAWGGLRPGQSERRASRSTSYRPTRSPTRSIGPSTTRFEISPDFCQNHDLTIERHIERLIAVGRTARQRT